MSLLSREDELRYVDSLRANHEGKVQKERLALMDPVLLREAELSSKKMMEKMAAPGELSNLIPPLLDWRRGEHGITNAAFNHRCAYDRIFVFQISQFDQQETYGDTGIIMADSTKQKERAEAPRGVIVSAGLLALDNLRSNGIDLGHIVSFVHAAPWRMRFDVVNGRNQHLLVLRDGDLIASEDTERLLRGGYISEQIVHLPGEPLRHTYNAVVPDKPWMNEAY